MGFLHMLFAVALPLGLVGTRFEKTVVYRRGLGMLVVDVAVPLLFGRPSDFIVLARLFGTFPWSGVRLLVFASTD